MSLYLAGRFVVRVDVRCVLFAVLIVRLRVLTASTRRRFFVLVALSSLAGLLRLF